jgi:hypothetical protein
VSSEKSSSRPDLAALLLLVVLLALMGLEVWTIVRHVGRLF